ncbi:U4/U6-U5 snRNP complex subunit lsm6 [Rhizina undulata]
MSDAANTGDPSGFLSEILGAPITVKLNSGVEYKGELSSVDGYMNIALEKTEEYVGGQLKNRYGDVFIRGNNGIAPLHFRKLSGHKRRGRGIVEEGGSKVTRGGSARKLMMVWIVLYISQDL